MRSVCVLPSLPLDHKETLPLGTCIGNNWLSVPEDTYAILQSRWLKKDKLTTDCIHYLSKRSNLGRIERR